jgi:3-deoxy-D-manno-octulosonate 8-phosphate phosphatase (KDO 8-P phosphatase)
MYRELLAEEGLSDREVAFMGDDVLDLPVLSRVGLSAAPADAAPDVLARVNWVSRRVGGDGAARELIELLLREQGAWDGLLDSYTRGEPR